tara:strand:- start:710 stop:1048 length:339 start_codon:yes stop_codon:yes gene_type:complete
MSLEWNGDRIKRLATQAAKWGIDATTAACVREAKNRVPVVTATLQGSIEMRPAQQRGNDVVGIWGSFNVNYAIFVEMGTSRMSGTPYLRPSADSQYPRLEGRIKRRFAELTR